MTNAAESDIRKLAEETIRLGEQATPDWSSWIYGDLTVRITAPDAETVIAKFAWEDRQSRKQAERNCVFAAHARTAAPALARAVLAMQWRPIAEAPRDGSLIWCVEHGAGKIILTRWWSAEEVAADEFERFGKKTSASDYEPGWGPPDNCREEVYAKWWMPLDALPRRPRW